jgi:hypothetical protein
VPAGRVRLGCEGRAGFAEGAPLNGGRRTGSGRGHVVPCGSI